MSAELAQLLIVGGWYAFEWVLRVLALFIVPRNRKPTAGMAWLLAIFLIPVIGWPLFLLLGSPKLPKHRRDMQRVLDRQIDKALGMIRRHQGTATQTIDVTPPEKYHATAQLSRNLTHMPVFGGNRVAPLDDYNGTIERIARDVAKATQFVYIEYYTLALDDATEPLFQAIEQATARGVRVHVLYDAYGSRKYPRKQEMLQRLKNAGVYVRAMLPMKLFGKNFTRPDLRNHRKLVVVDGVVGYTGSLNMIQRNYHRKDAIIYDELTLRVEGPVVLQLEAVFVTDWHAETGEILLDSQRHISDRLVEKGSIAGHVIPSGPGYEYENNLKAFNSVFYAAQKSITIVNPYFVPDESLSMSLINAAQRGVRVILINSEAIDQALVGHAQRSYYEQMLHAGIEIYLYQAPTLLHSKFTLIDNDCVLVGSSNMDMRSFQLNQELTLALYGTEATRELRRITTGYLAKSRRVTRQQWARRSQRSRLLDNLARLTSSIQ